MQLNMETFNLIHKPCCSSSHSSCREDPEDVGKSPVKIMLLIILNVGVSLGINNLWSRIHHKSGSSVSRKHGMSIWMMEMITILFCLIFLAACTQAYPMRDHREEQSRRYFLSPGLGDDPAAQRSFSGGNSSGDSTLSLSIFSPLDILRQNMLLEIRRKRLRHAKQRQVQSNKEYLDRIG